MSSKIVLYEKPTCTKCRQANKLLKENDVDYEKVNYYERPLSAKKLSELLKKMDMTARDLLRSSEKVYRDLGLSKADLSDKELVNLMVENPDLIQRPILEKGSKAVLGRPTENIHALLD